VSYEPFSGVAIRVVQDPPRRRVDLLTKGVLSRSLTVREGSFLCVRPPSGGWGCRGAEPPDRPGGLLDPGEVNKTVDRLQAHTADYRFEAETRQIAGVDARCLVVTPRAGGRGETLCVSDEGATLLVERPDKPTVRAGAYTTAIAPDAFRVPAEVARDDGGERD
jgi:hypothetical protein